MLQYELKSSFRGYNCRCKDEVLFYQNTTKRYDKLQIKYRPQFDKVTNLSEYFQK